MLRAVFLFVMAFSGLFLTGSGAQASEPLYFSAIPPESDAARALNLLERAVPEVAAIEGGSAQSAAFDLNGDGADEIFLKIAPPPACRGPCLDRFFVFGEGDGRFSLIGNFAGNRILVADTRSFGTRDMIVFDDPLDDFHSTRWGWIPAQRRYGPSSLDSPALLEDK